MQIKLVFKTIGYEIDLGAKSATHESAYRFSIIKVWYERKKVMHARMLLGWFPVMWYLKHKQIKKKIYE